MKSALILIQKNGQDMGMCEICELTYFANETKKLTTELKTNKQEWISVEDRLPDNDYEKHWKDRNYYLVYTEPRGIMYEATFGYEEHNWWVAKESIFDRVLSLDFGEDVTHYMPLPTPPKMKGADNEYI